MGRRPAQRTSREVTPESKSAQTVNQSRVLVLTQVLVPENIPGTKCHVRRGSSQKQKVLEIF